MGSRLSRSRKESKKGATGKKSVHVNNRRHLQRIPSSIVLDQDEPDYYSIPSFTVDHPLNNRYGIQESSVVSTKLMICENERYEKRKSALQRSLPSIPSNTKECASLDGEGIYESAPKLLGIDELDGYTESRFVSELCLQCSAVQVYDLGTEAQALNEATVGPPSRSTGYSAEAPTPREPNKWKETAPDDNHTTVDPVLTIQSTEETCMQINGCISETDRFNPPSESNENDCVPKALVNNNESEDSAFYQVSTQNPGSDYVRADFNLNTGDLVGTNAHKTARNPYAPVDHSPSYALPRPKTQTIVDPTLEPRVHGGVFLYPVPAGTKRTISGATVEVPFGLGRSLRLGCVEVGWSNSAGEFPVLAPGQHPLTKVLHCLPHRSTFILPVIVSVTLPVIEGQIEIFYSPTDVDQTSVWTKLRAIDAPENTHFTDDNIGPFCRQNFVTLERNRGIARFELRHFCAFFIVENGRVIEAKKTKASVLLKNEFSPNCCSVIVRVVLGCLEDFAQQKMMEKLRIYKSEGFRVLDDVEFNLFASESRSMVKVKISKIKWLPVGDIVHEDLDTEEFESHHLWNYGTVGVMFWQCSQMTNGVKPEAFAATVHIQQDDRQDMRTKIFCSLKSPLPLNEERLHMLVDDHVMIQRCDKLAKDFPNCMSLDVVAPTTAHYTPSPCSSEYKFEMDLHSNSSEPEIKAAAPLENLASQQKEIETG